MLIENIELTMSHVGLGSLNEPALMVLFGNAHSHQLTHGLDIHAGEIKDAQGFILYPAYYMTHLKVPLHSLLLSYQLWDSIEIGVDVNRFGDTLLESTYVLGKSGILPQDISAWDDEQFPTMKGSNLIVIDATQGEHASHSSAPQSDCIASLPKMKKPPEAIAKSKKIRTHGFEKTLSVSHLKNSEPIVYEVAPSRDIASGHAMIFAKFCEVMDYAEFSFLSQYLKTGFPTDVLTHLAVLERETYYYGNCFAGETLEIYVKGTIEEVSSEEYIENLNLLPVANFQFQIEIYQQKKNLLLAIANVKKVLAIPMQCQNLVPDIKRLLTQHSYSTLNNSQKN